MFYKNLEENMDINRENLEKDTENRQIPLLDDLIIKIALDIEFRDLLAFCLSCRKHNQLLNDNFWRQKIMKDKVLYGREIYSIKNSKKYYLDNFGEFQIYNTKILVVSCRGGDLKTVEKMLACGADVNYKPFLEFKTSLIEATAKGHLPIVRKLIEYGAGKHYFNLGYSLVAALLNKHYEIATYLVSQGADVHYDDDWAIEIATRDDKLNVIFN